MNVEKRLHKWLTQPEIIGPKECPLIHRWTLVGRSGAQNGRDQTPFKVMIHHFLPGSSDRDPHDHPRSFITIVLRGRYEDHRYPDGRVEVMRPGIIRLRRATHSHKTMTSHEGCWTLVLMGPQIRAWGFWRDGEWIAFLDYVKRFGEGMRCP